MDKRQQAKHDAAFMRKFGLILAGLTLIGVIIVVLARVVTQSFQPANDSDETAIAARVAPVGSVNTSGQIITLAGSAPATGPAAAAPATAAAAANPGEATYNKICFACHAQAVAGAPKLGDAAAWEPRIATGLDTLYKHAIEGFQGETGLMPPKGGAPDIVDEDVKAAVDYMVHAVQGGGAAAPAPATEAPAAPAPESGTDAGAAAPTGAAAAAEATEPALADTGKGKEVYGAVCFACHATGAAGAPKLGDAAAWGPRVAQGLDKLYDHSINGFMGEAGLMPPKGGRPDFADADVKAAVDYMVANSR